MPSVTVPSVTDTAGTIDTSSVADSGRVVALTTVAMSVSVAMACGVTTIEMVACAPARRSPS